MLRGWESSQVRYRWWNSWFGPRSEKPTSQELSTGSPLLKVKQEIPIVAMRNQV
jgi:hypothetical protein